jgi:hypothetical protein
VDRRVWGARGGCRAAQGGRPGGVVGPRWSARAALLLALPSRLRSKRLPRPHPAGRMRAHPWLQAKDLMNQQHCRVAARHRGRLLLLLLMLLWARDVQSHSPGCFCVSDTADAVGDPGDEEECRCTKWTACSQACTNAPVMDPGLISRLPRLGCHTPCLPVKSGVSCH